MGKFLVSIIVPVYNVEKYLARCLNSLVNQTLEKIQIVVVNDGSPDGSQQIIDRYAREYPRLIKGLCKENGGLSDARNYGIQFAEGEYLGFVDGDDFVDPCMYEKLYTKACSSGADIVVCGYYALDEEAGGSKRLQMGNMEHHNKSVHDNPKLLFINAPYAWNKLYRKRLFTESKIKFPKGLIFEDICTIYPLFSVANKIAKVNESLYYYIRKREGSITGTYSPKAADILESLAFLNNYFKGKNFFDRFFSSLLFINLKHILNRLFEYIEHDNTQFKKDFLKAAFVHLNSTFPGWKKDTQYFDIHFRGRGLRRRLYTSELFWRWVLLTPVNVLKLLRKINSLFRFRPFFTRSAHYKFIYAWCYKYLKIRKKTVLFESFHGTTISDSPFYLMKELSGDRDFTIFYATNDCKKHKQYLAPQKLPVKLVKLKSVKYQKLLASCEFLVNNVSFPPYFIRKKGQYYLNTWHGTPLKTLGKRMNMGIESMHNIQRNFFQADVLLFPNEFTKNRIMEDYNLDALYSGTILMSGYPRNSIFFNPDSGGGVRRQLDLTDKTVYAYMPTWRGANSIHVDGRTYSEELYLILQAVDDCLNDSQAFFVNLHPILKKKLDMGSFKHIYNFPEQIDNYEFLNCADVLITDYSSIFFDFSISKKPIIMFMYDYKAYTAERGFYFDPTMLPFTKAYTTRELVELLTETGLEGEGYENEEILDQYLEYESPDTPKKVLDFFFYGGSGGGTVIRHNDPAPREISIVRMPRIKTMEELERIYDRHPSENVLYVFEKAKFTPELNSFLHEKYNDKMTYVVVSTSELHTYLESLGVRLFKSERISEAVRNREFKRILPQFDRVREERLLP